MRLQVVVLLVLSSLTPGISAAFENREEYARCVAEQLEGGAPLAAIGDACLKRALLTPANPESEPKAPAEEVVEEEPYPYEKSLRETLTIQGGLFDPESVRFKELVYGEQSGYAWCGQMNAKNRYGGYVGWKYFAVRDRFRDRGSHSDYIDLAVGGREIEGKCKEYRAWVRENWL